MTAPSRLAAVGIGKEATYSVPVAATNLLAVQPPQVVDRVSLMRDVGWRSSPVDGYGHVLGPVEGGLQFAGNVYADTIGFPLAGILGDVTFTGGTANTHAMSLLTSGSQQPTSHTITTWDSINALQWAGCRWAEVALQFAADGLLTWSGTVAALDAAVTTPPALTQSTVPMFAGWRGVVKLGGSVEARVMGGEVKLTRTVTAERNADGVLAPWLQRAGTIAVKGSLQLAMAADTYRAAFVAGSQTSIDINYQQGSGATATGVQVHCSKAFLTGAAKGYGQRWIELALEFEADGNATDAGASGGLSPVKVTLTNAVASGVYV